MNQSRRERIATAKMAVSNVVQAAEQQAQDTVRQTYTLPDLVERAERDGVLASSTGKAYAEDVVNIEGVQELFIFDAQ